MGSQHPRRPGNGRPAPARTPAHLWVVGAAMLALYAGGAWDYAHLLGPDLDYIDGQGWGADAVAYFSDYPAALRVLWTANIAAGLTAPVLLLLRSRHAAWCALVAVLSLLVLMAVTFARYDRWSALGVFTNAWDFSIAAVTLAFWTYCLLMRHRAVLG